jgi:sulfite exporter TauE/SafE
MQYWTAFILGLVGSLHCAGMCGPLVLALPSLGERFNFLLGRLAYNLGRVTVYMLLGAFFGLFGKVIALGGAQRWLSIGTGLVILGGLVISRRKSLNGFLVNMVSMIKKPFTRILNKPTLPSLFLLGSLNGFLPCGLVYVACVASVPLANPVLSAFYMMAFGFGTLPMMLIIGLSGKPLQASLRFRFQRVIPYAMGCVGILLVVRGLSLGIPYLSPRLDQADPRCHSELKPRIIKNESDRWTGGDFAIAEWFLPIDVKTPTRKSWKVMLSGNSLPDSWCQCKL